MKPFVKTGITLANFISVGTIAGEKEVLKIISSGFDRAIVKILRISTDILKGPVDSPDSSFELSSSISRKIVEKIKKLG